MATLGDADDVKQDLALLLDGPTFQTALSAVVAAKQDGIVPLLPAAVYQEERLSHLAFPMVELIVFKESFSDPSDVVKAYEVEVGVRWTTVATDEATVTQHVERLARATVDLLHGTILQRVKSGPVIIREVDYSPLLPTADHPFVKSAVVVVAVQIWRA